jgi:hypothetical protein
MRMRKTVADEEFALCDLMNAPDKFFHGATLENVTAGACLQSSYNIMIVAMDSEDNSAGFRNGFLYPPGGFDAVQVGH